MEIHDDCPCNSYGYRLKRKRSMGSSQTCGLSWSWRLLIIGIGLFGPRCTITGTDAKVATEPPVPILETWSLAGGVAELPCDVTSPLSGDRVLLVLWYKDGQGTPIYSVDSRGKSFHEARHWSDELTFSGRAFFRTDLGPARLVLEALKPTDEAVFRCRVDFKKSPTRNVRVNLTVVVPPTVPVILDESGTEVHGIAGPYQEHDQLVLTCLVNSGRPLPQVTWWRDGHQLEGRSELVPGGRIKSILRLGTPGLTRTDLGSVIRCQANNSNLTTASQAAVLLDLKLPVLRVRILGDNRPLSARKPHDLHCQAWGAKPPAKITWWKGSTRLQPNRESFSNDGNMSASILTFLPAIEDGGKYITCRAENPDLPSSIMEDTWKLDVQYVPIVNLELGSKLKAGSIKEGDDVYLECNIQAHPWVTRVSWKHNGRALHQNSSAGIIMSNQSLVLQRIDRRAAGLYTCVAVNMEGEGESNALPMPVKFRPQCQPNQQTAFGGSRGDVIDVPCSIDAHPSDVTFRWVFNNSLESYNVPLVSISSKALRSNVEHSINSEKDFGTLQCWAKNTVGEQLSPCLYSIVAAGQPSSPYNCSVSNLSAEALHVTCLEGFDGGLSQQFVLEIRTLETDQVVYNVTNARPVFQVSGLPGGTALQLYVWAVNAKGRSAAALLLAETGRPAEKRTEMIAAQAVIFQMTPVLGALIGVVAALVMIAVIIVIIVRIRGSDDISGSQMTVQSLSKKVPPISIPQDHSDSDDGFDKEERNPDIIPNQNDPLTKCVGVSTVSGPMYGKVNYALESSIGSNCGPSSHLVEMQLQEEPLLHVVPAPEDHGLPSSLAALHYPPLSQVASRAKPTVASSVSFRPAGMPAGPSGYSWIEARETSVGHSVIAIQPQPSPRESAV